ncbi:hypothetical protein MPER_13949, partial [Moniliophthora perniciosa FA553]
WPVIVGLSIPPIAGAVALLKLGRGPEHRGALLACYYVLELTEHCWTHQKALYDRSGLCCSMCW